MEEDDGSYIGKAIIAPPSRLPQVWPATIAEVAKALPGVNERYLRRKVRELNCCAVIGNKIYLSAEDFETLMEATRPRPRQPRGPRSWSYSGGLFGPNSYEKALELSAKSKPKNSRWRKELAPEGRPSMGRKRKPKKRD